jgi:hypothetical protein
MISRIYNNPDKDVVIDNPDEEARILRASSVRVINACEVVANSARISGGFRADDGRIAACCLAVEAKIGGNFSIRRAEIGKRFDASISRIKGSLTAGGAKIGGDLLIDGTKIDQNFLADNAEIGGVLDASLARINGSFSIAGAKIGDILYALRAKIAGEFSANSAVIGGIAVAPPGTVAERDMASRVINAALNPGALNMTNWHTCETTHCIAGWAQVFSGRDIDINTAYDDGRELVPSLHHLFFLPTRLAIRELRRISKELE